MMLSLIRNAARPLSLLAFLLPLPRSLSLAPPAPPYTSSALFLSTPASPLPSSPRDWLSHERREVLPPGDAFTADLLRKRRALDDDACRAAVTASDEHPATTLGGCGG